VFDVVQGRILRASRPPQEGANRKPASHVANVDFTMQTGLTRVSSLTPNEIRALAVCINLHTTQVLVRAVQCDSARLLPGGL
jgi:hypothetical protein